MQHVVHNKYCHCLWVFRCTLQIFPILMLIRTTQSKYDYLHFSNVQISTNSSQVVCPRNPGCERESPMHRISRYQPTHTSHNASALNYNTTLYRLISSVRIQISEWTGRGKIAEVKLEEDSNFKDKSRTK